MRSWADGGARCGAADIAFTLEALGATPDGFERVLRLAELVTPDFCPAGLVDVAKGYRVGVAERRIAHNLNGTRLGAYGSAVVMAWTISTGRL